MGLARACVAPGRTKRRFHDHVPHRDLVVFRTWKRTGCSIENQTPDQLSGVPTTIAILAAPAQIAVLTNVIFGSALSSKDGRAFFCLQLSRIGIRSEAESQSTTIASRKTWSKRRRIEIGSIFDLELESVSTLCFDHDLRIL
jgi:hypothetical protein